MELSEKSLSPFEWPEYQFYLLFAYKHGAQSAQDNVSAQYGFWPLRTEEHWGDTEPTPKPGIRFLRWKRLTRTDIPKGWRTTWRPKRDLYIGYHLLTDEYHLHWSKRVQQYRRRWQRELLNKYEILDITYDEFASAYASSTVAREIPTLELIKLRKRLEVFPDRVHMLGVRHLGTGDIVGGHAFFDAPELKASHYSCGFYLEEVRHDRVMIGLMDRWFNDSLQKRYRVLHFGTFQPPNGTWRRGHQISFFKGQFVTDYLLYQPLLWKIL